ncbi:MAG TPA: chemotaxis protein CheA, partial [bacterium]|nr:chemotaxis protein CheA [bacterium]
IVEILLKVIDRITQIYKNIREKITEAKKTEKEKYLINISEIEYEDLIEEIQKIKGVKQKKEEIKEKKEIKKEISEEIKRGFISQTEDRLNVIEEKIIKIEKKEYIEEDINQIYRELHTIKGDAQLIISQLQTSEITLENAVVLIQKISHLTETLINKIKTKEIEINEKIIDLLLNVIDEIRRCIKAFKNNEKIEKIPMLLLEELSKKTKQMIDYQIIKKSKIGFSAEEAAFYNISIQMLKSIVNIFNELVSKKENKEALIKRLRNNIKTIISSANIVKRNDLINFSNEQLKFLDFISENEISEIVSLIETTREEFRIWLENLQKEQTTKIEEKKKEEEKPKVEKEEVEIEKAITEIKVTMEKLDNLMGISSELIVAKSSIDLLYDVLRKTDKQIEKNKIIKEIKDISNKFSKLSDDLHQLVMDIRMVPIKTIFNRFTRMVRDISRNNNKKVRLEMYGEEVKLDKAIIEKIIDPLLHILRNSVDHGIEKPDERKKAGKNEEGIIKLTAINQNNNVYIEIKDDGRGIDIEKIKKKIIEKGLSTEEEVRKMTKKEIIDFIFLPGFSTAEKVTEISGRGVGMDVVKTNITLIGGKIEIDSEYGVGTTITIILPLTLAITRALEVSCNGDLYLIPIETIFETIKIKKEDIVYYKNKKMVYYRGRILPIVFLSEILNYSVQDNSIYPVVVISSRDKMFGLVVDKFFSERQIIIKSLNCGLEKIPYFSGASIMADGSIELILNPAKLL